MAQSSSYRLPDGTVISQEEMQEAMSFMTTEERDEMLRLEEARVPELLSSSLTSYIEKHDSTFQSPWHVQALIEKLEAVERGDIKRLMIFMPPRHSKSFVTSTFFPAWFMGRNPSKYFIFATYSSEFSEDFGRKVRGLVTGDHHKKAFPLCKIPYDSSSIKKITTTKGGTYFAIGRGGSITGRGAHVLLIDDPYKDQVEAKSSLINGGVKTWYKTVAHARLQKDAAIILVMTRWTEDDLAGWLMREHANEDWEKLSFSAVAEKDEPHRKMGEPLWPSMFDRKALDKIRILQGTYNWAALYQQRPTPEGGGVFKSEWFQTYDEPPKEFLRIIVAWDTAMKTKEMNDYSACVVFGETRRGIYVLFAGHWRAELPELVKKIQEIHKFWNPSADVIEDKASGVQAIQVLRRETSLPVLARKLDIDSVARARLVTPRIEAGRVFLPKAAGWLQDFNDEVLSFPNATHDDIQSAFVVGLSFLQESGDVVPGEERVHSGGPVRVYQKKVYSWPIPARVYSGSR